MTSEPKQCPKCGAPIRAEAPQGLCPKCLLAQASIPTDAGSQGSSRPAPPKLEEIAAAFPQLQILELIGQGGMGFVYKARQARLERFVALKILPQSHAGDPAFAERFTREGRVLARLNHPNIVTIHDFGQANGFFYLLMEFVDGVNLRQAMRTGRFTPEQALAVVPKICDALQFAHNEGILHRDIKPENILLDAKGRVKIADFGIAKLVGEPHSDAHLTASGGTLGTPHYMAPEQIEKPSSVDHRADIYSLGVVFYEMLTGELPLGKFQAPSQKVHVDVRLDDVVLHALEKEPERRYQQVSEVKTAVDTIAVTPAPPSAPPHGFATPGAPATAELVAAPKPDLFWRRFAVLITLAVAAVLVIPVVAILLAIVIPAFQAARARDAAVRAEMQVAASRRAASNELAKVGSTLIPPASVEELKTRMDGTLPSVEAAEAPANPAVNARAIASPARFEFRWVARDQETNSPADWLPDMSNSKRESKLCVLKEVLLDGDGVASAGFTRFDPDHHEIAVLLTDRGGHRFADLTAANVGRRLAIIWNGRVLSAPVIRDAITSRQVMITSNLGSDESLLLVDVLNHRQPTAQRK